MAQFGFNFKAAFDSAAVTKRLDRATRRVLSKFGAFVRRRARSSIRTRKKTSAPGQPPTNRTGLLKNFILFFYDADREGVVIGAAQLNGRAYRDAPEKLEYGGPAIRRFFEIKNDKTGETRIASSRRAPARRVNYEPRPFMNPALDRELPGLPGMWADQIY